MLSAREVTDALESALSNSISFKSEASSFMKQTKRSPLMKDSDIMTVFPMEMKVFTDIIRKNTANRSSVIDI